MIDIPPLLEDTDSWPHWYLTNWLDTTGGVTFCCPNGHRLILFNPDQPAPRHGIAPDGTVDGSVVCKGTPNDPCEFHEMIRLLDWTGGSIARL